MFADMHIRLWNFNSSYENIWGWFVLHIIFMSPHTTYPGPSTGKIKYSGVSFDHISSYGTYSWRPTRTSKRHVSSFDETIYVRMASVTYSSASGPEACGHSVQAEVLVRVCCWRAVTLTFCFRVLTAMISGDMKVKSLPSCVVVSMTLFIGK